MSSTNDRASRRTSCSIIISYVKVGAAGAAATDGHGPNTGSNCEPSHINDPRTKLCVPAASISERNVIEIKQQLFTIRSAGSDQQHLRMVSSRVNRRNSVQISQIKALITRLKVNTGVCQFLGSLSTRLRNTSMFTLPIPEKHGDCNLLETMVNVATSVPFICVGLQTPRSRPTTKMFARSLIGVGVTSSLYHTSRGEARKIFRWADHAMISISALCLSRALRSDAHRQSHHGWALTVASTLLMLFKPSLVTVVHTGMSEVAFYRTAMVNKSNATLQRAHKVHMAASIVGLTLFVADGVFLEAPFIHSTWHIVAALGVATYSHLLGKTDS